jgi:hypothetical protein
MYAAQSVLPDISQIDKVDIVAPEIGGLSDASDVHELSVVEMEDGNQRSLALEQVNDIDQVQRGHRGPFTFPCTVSPLPSAQTPKSAWPYSERAVLLTKARSKKEEMEARRLVRMTEDPSDEFCTNVGSTFG